MARGRWFLNSIFLKSYIFVRKKWIMSRDTAQEGPVRSKAQDKRMVCVLGEGVVYRRTGIRM